MIQTSSTEHPNEVTAEFDAVGELSDLAGWAAGDDYPPPPATVCQGLRQAVAGGSRPAAIPSSVAEGLDRWLADATDQARRQGRPLCRKANWPGAAQLAVFLSHDVDQIHDRELFRWLGDVNHLRRHWFKGERGRTWPCLRRIARPLLRPIDPMIQFRSIRQLQGRYGWRSTFFLLEDRYWGRLGGRFRWDDADFVPISEFLLQEGCELGIHGSAYAHDQASWWHDKRQRFEGLFGQPPSGARNHYLSLRVPETWHCQQQAGLQYDATLGYPNQLGAPGDYCYPLRVVRSSAGAGGGLIELPLTIMDVTLFRYLGLNGPEALAASQQMLATVARRGGLASILWHNNFFSEEEYRDWEETYAAILDWLAPQQPWVATGRDIAQWWVARSQVQLRALTEQDNQVWWELSTVSDISDLALEVYGVGSADELLMDRRCAIVRRGAADVVLNFPRLAAGEHLRFGVNRGRSEASCS